MRVISFAFIILQLSIINQYRSHLVRITDIYVTSFLRSVRGSLAPRFSMSILSDVIRHIDGIDQVTNRPVVYYNLTHACVYFIE